MNRIKLIIYSTIGILFTVFSIYLVEGKTSKTQYFNYSLTTTSGEHSLILEEAKSNPEKTKGLMFRDSLAEKHGMIFIFDKEDDYKFWMKNTSISLDLILINSDYKIVDIVQNLIPYSTKPTNSNHPYKYAIELNSGSVEKYRIQIGDKISKN